MLIINWIRLWVAIERAIESQIIDHLVQLHCINWSSLKALRCFIVRKFCHIILFIINKDGIVVSLLRSMLENGHFLDLTCSCIVFLSCFMQISDGEKVTWWCVRFRWGEWWGKIIIIIITCIWWVMQFLSSSWSLIWAWFYPEWLWLCKEYKRVWLHWEKKRGRW